MKHRIFQQMDRNKGKHKHGFPVENITWATKLDFGRLLYMEEEPWTLANITQEFNFKYIDNETSMRIR